MDPIERLEMELFLTQYAMEQGLGEEEVLDVVDAALSRSEQIVNSGWLRALRRYLTERLGN